MTAERWQQIKAVLGDVMERPPVERATFLDQVCGDDLTLRAEVEAYMAYEQSDDNGKESPAAYIQSLQTPLSSDLSPLGTANLESDESPDETNRRIGPYKIVSELGRGGMGMVYMAARADDQYRRQVAIKLIRRGMDTDFVLRRFRNERQILAGLDHPNIAKLLDGGATDDGLPYLVMEYVAGIPIDDYCDQHALDTQQRLRLFQQVCGAIQYAHQRQVIHRDIKPSNILVGETSGLKLLDFGIAKLLTPELAAQTLDPTAPALRLMTPAYASPEQVKGEPVTTTTDVYSLGVLLYELLTGHKPYRIKSHAPHQISQAVLEEEPLKPSTAITLTEETVNGDGSTACTLTPESVSKTREGTPDRLRRRLRGDLDNIVLSALRKDPRRRYASVEQFSEDIRRHLAGLPVIARKDSLVYRTSKFIGRNRIGVAAVILTTLLLASVALLTNLWTSSQSNQSGAAARSIAVLPFKTIGAEPGDEYLGLGISDAITSTLTRIKQLTVRPIRRSLTYAGTNQDPIETGQALRVDAILEGTIGKVSNRLLITARLIRVDDGSKLWEMMPSDGSQNLMVVQEAISAQVARALGVKLTDQEMTSLAKQHTESLEAYHLYLKGRYLSNQKAWKERKEGIECFAKAINVDPNFAQAYADLAFSQIPLTNPLPTMEKMQRAKEVAVKALDIDDTLAEAHTALGRAITFCDWDWAGAEREFKRAIELRPNYAEARNWYSDNLSANGRHDAAISELERAQEIDPFSPRYHLRLGWAYYFARRYDQAIEEFRKTPLDLDESDFQVYQVYWRLGLVYLQKSMYEEGISMIKKAENLSGELPLTRASLAYAYAKSGNHGEARKILDEFKGISKQVPFLNLAAAYACLSDKDSAFEWLERAYQQRDNRIIHIKVEPMLDSMRSDPRFEDLLRRIGLVP